MDLLKQLARSLGLGPLAIRIRDAVRALRYKQAIPPDSRPDGLPLPPPRLALRVTGTPDLVSFVEGGRHAADSIRESLARQGMALGDVRSLLDFGCGCGRVIRHWRDARARIRGTDADAGAIAWCRRNLPFAQFSVNALRPPLEYAEAEFDLVYALSVFTHLPEELQRPWLEELARVLLPGGHLLVSVHGEAYLPRLSEDERRLFRAGDLVVRRGAPGSTHCGAYHPRRYLNRVLPPALTLVEVIPEGARGNPPQDLVVLRKHGEVAPAR